jgi:hypothetical protein
MKLDIGCGKDKKEGFIGIDIDKDSDADFIMDLRKDKLNFKDVEEIRMKHFLEHLTIGEIKNLFNQFKRICRKGCVFDITAPHFSSHACFQISHKTPFRTDAFDVSEIDKFWTVEERRICFDKRIWYPWNYLIEPLINLNNATQRYYEKTGFRNIFPAFEVRFKLKVKKI